MDQFLTLEKAKIGPVLTLQHIYICIHGDAQCEVLSFMYFPHCFKHFQNILLYSITTD